MSTFAEIKDAAARLPADQRSELITWVGQAEDVSRIRREQLRREIQIGLDKIEHGEVAPLDVLAIKHKARTDRDMKSRG